jgi:hypothetical protein
MNLSQLLEWRGGRGGGLREFYSMVYNQQGHLRTQTLDGRELVSIKVSVEILCDKDTLSSGPRVPVRLAMKRFWRPRPLQHSENHVGVVAQAGTLDPYTPREPHEHLCEPPRSRKATELDSLTAV